VALLTAVMGTALFAQGRTPMKLPAKLSDYFAKGVKFTVTAPNIVEVKGNVQDMGGSYIKDIPYNGQKQIVIKVRSFSGKFRWDHGKMFGVTFGNQNDAKSYLPDQNGKKLMDKMIDGPFNVGDECVFNIPADVVASKPSTITFMMVVYGGGTFEIEFYFQ
jgi:hypothetical protein